MKTSAEKSSSTPSKTATQSAQPFFAKAGNGSFFAPAIQMKMAVSKPGDKFEQEADKMADKVMRMPTPAPTAGKEEKLQRQPEEKLQKKEEDKIQKAAMPEEKVQKKEEDKIQKAPAPEEKLQRDGTGTPAVSPSVQSAIQNKTSGGQPLSSDVRSYMEPRFNADFSKVRVHHDAESASLNNQLSARAFTHQNHVFFSRDQYQPGSSEGKQLLAHELTHTIQQGHAVQRSPQVSTTTTPPSVQRLGMQDALDYFADKAGFIPGFTLLTVLLGFNPINRRSVDRSAANILKGLIELIPGGALITQALNNHGVLTKAGAWVEQQIATLGDIGSDIVAGLKRFIDSLSWTDIFDLSSVWERAKSIFTNPVGRLISFAAGVAIGIMNLVKEAVLRPLAKMAEGTAGYDLLKAVLGQDPVTGDPVPRTAETLIGGFMKLIGQEEIWENIKKGNAVARAWAWFQGALAGLMAFAQAIPAQIIATISSITWQDVITIVGVFSKVGKAFLGIAGEFLNWAGAQVISLLEIIFSVVAPDAVPYIKKAQGAFQTIIKNPIGFVGNLVSAGKLGFQMFANNIGTHLKTALIKWITGPLGDAGVYIPKSFDLMEIIKLVLSILGLTWQNIRTKLVKIIPEPILTGLEKTAGILVTLVKDGPVAAWEQIKAELSELKDSLIAKVTEMITSEVVKAAVVKLVSMLNPAGAVIQAIIAIYKTITFFVEKIKQIAAVVASFIDSIAAIASGQIDGAAKKVEQTMANTLTIIIAFLAKFAGLGDIPEKIVGIIKKIRAPIDKGLDKIVAWLGGLLKNLASRVLGGDPNAPSSERVANGLREAVPIVNRYAGRSVGAVILRPLLMPIKLRHRLSRLDVIPQGNVWAVEAAASPSVTTPTSALVSGTNIPPNVTPPATLGTAVVFTLRTGQAISTRVKAINVNTIVNNQTIIGTQLEWQNTWVPNSGYGTTWTTPPVPPFVPFASGPPRIVIDKAHLNSGTGTSGNPPGWNSSGKWNARGHLIPRVLGGPGSFGSGNIVAMTHQANATNPGMRGIEIPLRNDINNGAIGAIYDVQVLIDYDTSVQLPPVRVHVFSTRLYPNAQRPSSVPSSPYSFNNT